MSFPFTPPDRTTWTRTYACAMVVAGLLPAGVLAGNPPVAADAGADNQLIATVRQKSASVLRLRNAATNTLNLAEYIAIKPAQAESPTNATPITPLRLPEPEPVFVLRGLSSGNQRPLALVNNRWYGVGDRVASSGVRIAKIENNQVVLVDTQGVQQVVTLYHEHE